MNHTIYIHTHTRVHLKVRAGIIRFSYSISTFRRRPNLFIYIAYTERMKYGTVLDVREFSDISHGPKTAATGPFTFYI